MMVWMKCKTYVPLVHLAFIPARGICKGETGKLCGHLVSSRVDLQEELSDYILF